MSPRPRARAYTPEPWEQVLRSYSPAACKVYLWLHGRAGENREVAFTTRECLGAVGYRGRPWIGRYLWELALGHPPYPALIEIVDWDRGLGIIRVRIL
jgi:hypothetical protein